MGVLRHCARAIGSQAQSSGIGFMCAPTRSRLPTARRQLPSAFHTEEECGVSSSSKTKSSQRTMGSVNMCGMAASGMHRHVSTAQHNQQSDCQDLGTLARQRSTDERACAQQRRSPPSTRGYDDVPGLNRASQISAGIGNKFMKAFLSKRSTAGGTLTFSRPNATSAS